jgi:hypothetical protein
LLCGKQYTTHLYKLFGFNVTRETAENIKKGGLVIVNDEI